MLKIKIKKYIFQSYKTIQRNLAIKRIRIKLKHKINLIFHCMVKLKRKINLIKGLKKKEDQIRKKTIYPKLRLNDEIENKPKFYKKTKKKNKKSKE